ncbi:MAG: response regulator, partial [Burkholderiaceae bacterium]|nr:response regulator [Burkholderiaceae bacterium]
MLREGWRGIKLARIALIGFSVLCLALCFKLFLLDGGCELGLFHDEMHLCLAQMGLLLLLLMMLSGAGKPARDGRECGCDASKRMPAQDHEGHHVEQALAQRTHELSAELAAAKKVNRAQIDFLMRVSHDLRAPLTAILGFADLIQANRQRRLAHSRAIVCSAKHILTMVEDILGYARGEAGDVVQAEPVYVYPLLHAVAREAVELARKNGNGFQLSISAELPPVLHLDAKRLHRVLGNLLDNAAKFTVQGEIELVVECIVADRDGQWVNLEFRVNDSGCGIAPEFLARVFDPFERAAQAHPVPGIGLGLAIVRQWTQRMGGCVRIDSVPQVGTQVTLKLPAQIGEEATMMRKHLLEQTRMTPAIDADDRLAWVVEDNPDVGELLYEQLVILGFSVRLFFDAPSSIQAMGVDCVERPAVVLTDYLMPGADGVRVLTAVRRYLPGVPVVSVSAIAPSGKGGDGGENGFDARLMKPINFDELQETLARLLQLEYFDDASMVHAGQYAPLLLPWQLDEALRLIAHGALSELQHWVENIKGGHPQVVAFRWRARELIAE